MFFTTCYETLLFIYPTIMNWDKMGKC